MPKRSIRCCMHKVSTKRQVAGASALYGAALRCPNNAPSSKARSISVVSVRLTLRPLSTGWCGSLQSAFRVGDRNTSEGVDKPTFGCKLLGPSWETQPVSVHRRSPRRKCRNVVSSHIPERRATTPGRSPLIAGSAPVVERLLNPRVGRQLGPQRRCGFQRP